MRTLYLLRHAKASQPAGGSNDHGRPLTKDGAAAATQLGTMLKAHGQSLGHIVCSTSRRTVETYENVARAFPGLEATLDPRVYDADAKQLLAIVQAAANHDTTVTVVGHNPTIADLSLALAGGGDLEKLAAMAEGFPPGALARLEFEASRWADIVPGMGTLTLFHRPKDMVGPKDAVGA